MTQLRGGKSQAEVWAQWEQVEGSGEGEQLGL